MNKTNDPWSRCAKEFQISVINNDQVQLSRELDESIVRPVHVKRLDFNNGLSSCRGLVATDIALANLEEIERYELVSKWIADGLCTPPTSEQNTSNCSSPIFTTFVERGLKLDEESISSVIEKIDKSPVIKCRRKFIPKSKRCDKIIFQDLTKSPVICKRRRNSMHKKSRFGSWDKQKLDASCSSSHSDKSPILGKGLNSARKQMPRIKRKRLMDRIDSFAFSYCKDNAMSSFLKSPESELDPRAPIEVKDEIKSNADSVELSQDIFSEEIITASPKIGSMRSFGNRSRAKFVHKKKKAENLHQEVWMPLKTEDIKTETGPELKQSPPYWGNNEYCSSPRIGSEIKTKRIFKDEGNKSFGSIIEDTEEYILPEIQNRPRPDSSRSREDNKLLIFDSEFGVEKRKFITNTERIDYDTSSENGGDNTGTRSKRLNTITGVESDSDKTVSDIIEKPITQDPVEQLEKEPIIVAHSFRSRNPVSATSPKFVLGLNKDERNKSFGSIIEDTEEYILPEIQNRPCPDSSRSREDNKLLIFDSEFVIEKRKFITDTERIDYDTSSENGEDNTGTRSKRLNTITGVESDSDKTVSDIIEEPITQDPVEQLEQEPIIAAHSLRSRNPVSATSLKISETVSPKDLISPQISITDISVETTPPRTQESPPPVADLLDSGKKKKRSRPKKGSLGARLQKLISGQVSCVRLWRHQMLRESAFERSSAPCTTLLVLQAWSEYGKNLYQSEVLSDPYDLLNGCLKESTQSKRREKNSSRNLVVMTNPDFVGSVKLLPGTVFKIYLPWEIFNRNAGPGNLVLHALYFNVVSNPVKIELEQNAAESEAGKHSNELIENEIIRDYHCPCLENGKLDSTCLTKFTNHKIDIIAEMIK